MSLPAFGNAKKISERHAKWAAISRMSREETPKAIR